MELKHKSPEVAATTKGAIDNIKQDHVTYDRKANQGPKHVTFFLYRLLNQIENCRLSGGDI